MTKMIETPTILDKKTMLKAYRIMTQAKCMAELYEENAKIVSKYVHATSRGHEAIQIAAGLLLDPQDYVAPYYRDDAMILAMGMTPYDLMLRLKYLISHLLLVCKLYPSLGQLWVFNTKKIKS